MLVSTLKHNWILYKAIHKSLNYDHKQNIYNKYLHFIGRILSLTEERMDTRYRAETHIGQMVPNDRSYGGHVFSIVTNWANLTRLNCVTPETCRRGYSTTSGLLLSQWKMLGTDKLYVKRREFTETPHPIPRELLWNATSSHEPPHWHTVAILGVN